MVRNVHHRLVVVGVRVEAVYFGVAVQLPEAAHLVVLEIEMNDFLAVQVDLRTDDAVRVEPVPNAVQEESRAFIRRTLSSSRFPRKGRPPSAPPRILWSV